MTNAAQDILTLLETLSAAERRDVFDRLRAGTPLHPLETDLNTRAEVVLEAIRRAGGLVLRMIRGVIAEAAFAVQVVPTLDGWAETTLPGDHAYDLELTDAAGPVRVQVKLQRSRDHHPMTAHQARRTFSPDHFVVETQRTRGGTAADGSSTRPYRFGEFDIIAVSLYPSTGEWDTFTYSVARWLIPTSEDPAHIFKFQPVAQTPNSDWTQDFGEAVSWLRSGREKVISGGTVR